MPVLENARHERFAQGVFSGLSAAEAYQKADKCSRESAEANYARTMVNDGITARIAELNAAVAKAIKYEKADCIRDLVAMIHAEPDTADGSNRLANKQMTKMGPDYAFPDKLAVMTRIAKMLGWDEAEKVEVSGEMKVKGVLDFIGRREKK